MLFFSPPARPLAVVPYAKKKQKKEKRQEKKQREQRQSLLLRSEKEKEKKKKEEKAFPWFPFLQVDLLRLDNSAPKARGRD